LVFLVGRVGVSSLTCEVCGVKGGARYDTK
jgi:hypothetical protein